MRTGNEAMKLVVNYYWLHTVVCVHWNLLPCEIASKKVSWAQSFQYYWKRRRHCLVPTCLYHPHCPILPLALLLSQASSSQWHWWALSGARQPHGGVWQALHWPTPAGHPLHTPSQENQDGKLIQCLLLWFHSFCLVLTSVDIFLICFMLLLSMSTNVLFFWCLEIRLLLCTCISCYTLDFVLSNLVCCATHVLLYLV